MSKRIFAYTGFVSIAATVVYFLLLEKWLVPRISEMTRIFRWQFMVWSVFGGVFLMVVGTEAWETPSRNLVFLLPSQSIEISIPPQHLLSPPIVGITLLKTTTGGILLDATDYHGWKKIENTLVLQDWSNNSLNWTGKTGEKIVIVFQTTSPDLRVNITWSGEEENVILPTGKGGKIIYGHRFDIPGYASRKMVLLLGIINFTLITAIIISFIWHKRQLLNEKFTESLTYRLDKKENKTLELGIVVGLLFVSVMLRAFNLETLPPYRDEYAHINAAKDMVNGTAIGTVYQRSLWIVTVPVALAFQIFGSKLWAARFVGVLFNALAIIPLFLITRRMNKPIAIISAILFATSPWIIAVARNVREYAYYPFYYYWIVYGLIVAIERFPKRFSFVLDARKLLEPQFLFLVPILLFPIYYGLIFDGNSTFKLILGAYGIFCLFILMKIDFTDRTTGWLLLVAGMLVLAGVSLLLMGHTLPDIVTSIKLFFTGSFTLTPLKMFFTNPIQQWYYNKTMIAVALALAITVFISMYFYRTNFVPLFVLTLYLLQLVFFIFFFERYFRPRYMVSVQLWYIILLAIGTYGIWMILSVLLQKRITLLIAVALIAITFNGGQILFPSLSDISMPMPITDEYHENTKAANDFLFDKVRQGDVLISTTYASYAYFMGAPVFSKVYFYAQSQGYITSIIGQHDSGWIVMDDKTGVGDPELPRETFDVNSRKVEFLGKFGNQFIWKWYILK